MLQKERLVYTLRMFKKETIPFWTFLLI